MALPIVLVVDDDASTLRSIVRVLRSESIDLRATTSPAEAIEIARTEDVAALVFDLSMVEMNGNELAIQVRTLRPHVALIQMSGRSSLALLDVSAVLEKPWTAAHLREVIHGAVHSH
jgi:two-component system phosphoglycerate transport system response regulator PgtA